MNKRKALCLLMAAAMTVSTGLTAYAADTKIDKVRLEFSYGEAPKSGDDIGDITVRAKDSEYYVESAEYTNADNQDTWTVGDVPEVKIELYAKDGYRFSYTSKSHFTLSGCNATFKKAKVYDSGSYIEIYAELKRIGGKLEGTSNLEWEDTVAVWDEIDGAKSYDVKLLRDDKTVTTVSTTGTSDDFAGYFNREGDYTFRVRAIASYNSKTGEWSDDSDTLSIDEDEIANYGGSGHWVQDGNGWWYSYDTGGYPSSCWKQINGAWYHFNSSGYMQTGWLKLDGQWFYLADSGAMLIGWQAINGNWYYLGTDGVMYEDTWTPDGFYVNGSGVWVQ